MPVYKFTYEVDAPSLADAAGQLDDIFHGRGGRLVGQNVVKKGHSTKPKRCIIMSNGQYWCFKEVPRASDGAMAYAYVLSNNKIESKIFRTKVEARYDIRHYGIQKPSIVEI